ncbi:MAG: catalase [Deltaproteobacteria bacterium]|nr:catalase [Deltaproteobacteria bacterium]
MNERLRTESGAPVADNQNSQSAGPGGPLLLQDQHLIEKLARFNRERIPERVVHAVGSGAHGFFEVTNPELPRWTRMAMMSGLGKQTEVFARFSTVAGSKGAPDSVRDPRGFALKFYTEEGNWDLAGNNTPIFFLRDPIKFPDFIHSQKYDPFTNQQEPDNVWDFFSHSPEATHQFTWLFGDRGIPASYRHMNGYGSHTFQWVNAEGERHWVKFHFKTNQGIRCLSDEESARVAGANPQAHQQDLLQAIEEGDCPSWTLKVQLMPEADAATYRFNPFDLTKTWPHSDYPLIEVGTLTLNRNPDNYFAEVEQAAFDPGHFVPGIGPSPDKMLQGRLFAYSDAHRYRLGINHTRLPVNAPRGLPEGATNYGRDGAMRFDVTPRGAKNYEPNSFDGPVQGGGPAYAGLAATGVSSATPAARHAEDDDYVQAGALYRLMSEEERDRLVGRIAGSLAQVSRDDIVDRSIAHFRNADEEYGARLETALKEMRAG